MFRKPESVYSDSSGAVTWTYSYGSSNSVGKSVVNAIPIPGTGFFAPDSKTKVQVLSIMFDGGGIVRDYSYSESES